MGSRLDEIMSQKHKGNPRFLEGQGSLVWQQKPLKVRDQEKVIDNVALQENWRRKGVRF